jgi:hypothetical protein
VLSLTVVGVGVVSDVNMEVAVALGDVVNGHRAVGGATRVGVHSAGGGEFISSSHSSNRSTVARALSARLTRFKT